MLGDRERWAERRGPGGARRPPTTAPSGERPAPHPARRTRLVLKVQDGCDGACSYCAVRLVRGRPRSTPLGARAGRSLAPAWTGGCGEVVLSGIDLGAWRDGELRLPDLVSRAGRAAGLARLRLSSLEPRHLDDALAAALAHPPVARHLHVPLQSADDGVLAAMRRPYTFAEFERPGRRGRATASATS